jgi:hypothetical protein
MDRQTGGGLTPEGLFTDGDPQQGIPGTVVKDELMNAITEELRNLVIDAGLTPDVANYNQVREAIAIVSGSRAIMPNLCVGGSLEYWRRGFSHALAAANGERYTADRFACKVDGAGGAGAATIARAFQGGIAQAPAGMRHAMFWNQTAGATIADPVLIHRLEDVTVYSGRKVTISWLQRVIPGPMDVDVVLTQNFGTGGSASVAVGTQTVSVATNPSDFSRVSVTFDVPAVGGATVGPDSFLEVAWTFPAGATFQFYIGQVQMEFGDVSTPFEYLPLALDALQTGRYFQTSYEHGTVPGTATSKGAQQAFESFFRTQGLQSRFPLAMRVRPTIVWYSTLTGAAGKITLSNSSEEDVVSNDEVSLVTTGYPGFATQLAEVNMSAHFTADAEL